jgi:aminoglycoside 6-adenylyltransferase
MPHESYEQVISSLIAWANGQDAVRAMILTSSFAVPGAYVDVFSDYDLILIVRDVHPFHEERAWLEGIEPVLALYNDPLREEDGCTASGNITQFASGLKIDFTFWPLELLRKTVQKAELPDEFDAGYRVILDKDQLADGLKTPSYQAYIPKPPSAEEFRTAVEVFFVDVVYVAKYLWRDDFMAAKFVLDYFIKQENLRPMLEWHYETEHDWKVKPGPIGRGMKKWLRPDLWQDLEGTYAGAEPEDNWIALERTVSFMRKAGEEVAARLGYAYPDEIERGAMALVNEIRNQPH